MCCCEADRQEVAKEEKIEVKKKVTEHRRETLELEEQNFSKVILASAAREVCQHLRVKQECSVEDPSARGLMEEEVEMSRKVSNHLRFKIELEQREFANVTLASEDVNVRGAHRVMLAGASPLKKETARQVAKYLRQNLEKFAHEGAQIPTLWLCLIGEVKKDLTIDKDYLENINIDINKEIL